jgi:serine/threonine-protein kinase
MKILRRKWWDSADAIQIMQRELLVGSRVRHPNVVSVLDARLDDPPQFLVMPRLSGTTLAARMDRCPRLRPAQSLRIARQVAEGLAAILDACCMTHGDVKPANIFISNEGRATLLDLGFAHKPQELAAKAVRPFCGSLAYAAPETFTSTLAAGVQSEIYSLGATLYEMLSGDRPYAAADPGELVDMIRAGRPTCLRVLRPELPAPVASLVHRMLAKNPLRRPQTYAELIDELTRLEIGCFACR